MNNKKILFVTLVKIDDINVPGIYTDLISKFVSKGYKVTVICPIERRFGIESRIISTNGVKIIQVKSLNIQKTNILEKIVSTFLIEFLFIATFLKKCKNERYDIGLFTTPPIFITNFVKFANKNIKVKYLLLKDIFPQNALDLKITSKHSIFYWYSRYIEKKLYSIMDYIGCMSQANLEFIKENNVIKNEKLEINPNSIDILKYPKKTINIKKEKNDELRLIYGGNIGLPQNPLLIANFILKLESLENVSLKIIGSGTEFNYLKNFIEENSIKKTKILSNLSKKLYFEELDKSDIGLIFLNENFTIPNFPSRLLDYLYFDLAIISNTDKITDISDFITNEKVGKSFYGLNELDKMISEISEFQKNFRYLNNYKKNSFKSLNFFNVDDSYKLIKSKIKNGKRN